MTPQEAMMLYQEATRPIENAYQEALMRAQLAFHKAKIAAAKAHEKALAPHKETYRRNALHPLEKSP